MKKILIEIYYILKLSNEIFNGLVNFSKIKSIDTLLINFIKNEFKTEKNRNNLSCRKLAETYFTSTRNKTNRQTVCNQLSFRYRKTSVKNDKIKSNQNILITSTLIKIITRCIKIGFKIV